MRSHKRWETLMAENKGNIDLALAQKFLGDHFDTFDNKEQPGERSLCGHVDLSRADRSPLNRPTLRPALCRIRQPIPP